MLQPTRCGGGTAELSRRRRSKTRLLAEARAEAEGGWNIDLILKVFIDRITKSLLSEFGVKG